jgi:NADH-quinone oxidoreductase subunit M
MSELKFLEIGVLTWVTFLPILGMLIVLAIPKNKVDYIKWTSLGITFVQFVLCVWAWMNFSNTMPGINQPETMQFVEKFRWIDIEGFAWTNRIVIEYFLGVDGLSMPMVLLTGLISFLAVLSSFSTTGVDKAHKGYFALLLLLDTGMMGTFVALDFFLFFIFWEIMLLPMYFLIGIWGGPRRVYAAIKFFLYTLFGSAFILLVILGLYFSSRDPGTDAHTFNMLTLMNPANYLEGALFSGTMTFARLLGYIALFVGFAIKVPIVPFHTWLPDAHVEAPTPISVILAGILLKMGTYGMLRISYPIFPDAMVYFAYGLAVFGMINIVYGSLCAMAQTDFKKLIAYSSIAHMGYVVLGMASLTTQGITGAVFQMFNHGTITAMLFLIVGVLYDRAHERGLNDFGGLANQMPKYFGIVVIAFFAAMGLPGLSGFISEALAFLGAFSVSAIRGITIVSTLGIVLGAGYMLWTLQRLFFGNLPQRWEGKLTDMNWREFAALAPLAIIVIFLGVYPSPVLNMLSSSVNQLVDFVYKTSNMTIVGW